MIMEHRYIPTEFIWVMCLLTGRDHQTVRKFLRGEKIRGNTHYELTEAFTTMATGQTVVADKVNKGIAQAKKFNKDYPEILGLEEKDA